jgi:hypothetical protein
VVFGYFELHTQEGGLGSARRGRMTTMKNERRLEGGNRRRFFVCCCRKKRKSTANTRKNRLGLSVRRVASLWNFS